MASPLTAAVTAVTAARPRLWRWVQIVAVVGVLAILVWRVGTGPFLDAIRHIDRRAIIGALAISVPTTLFGALRWRLVAASVGIRVPLGHALAACYRSQFLNVTLPGGVAGDVHRAVRHGLDLGNLGQGIRVVAIERFAGQTVTVTFAFLTLTLVPSPAKPLMPPIIIAIAALALALVIAWHSRVANPLIRAIARQLPKRVTARWERVAGPVKADVRVLFTSGAWVGTVLTSVAAFTGHVATFVLAARTAGSTAPLKLLVPLLLIALLAMGLPLNVAGWGLREGAAAWAFGAAGLTMAEGVSTAVIYGVLVTVASLPGAGVLVVRWLKRELESGDTRD